jgi:hypothetical protein
MMLPHRRVVKHSSYRSSPVESVFERCSNWRQKGKGGYDVCSGQPVQVCG